MLARSTTRLSVGFFDGLRFAATHAWAAATNSVLSLGALTFCHKINCTTQTNCVFACIPVCRSPSDTNGKRVPVSSVQVRGFTSPARVSVGCNVNRSLLWHPCFTKERLACEEQWRATNHQANIRRDLVSGRVDFKALGELVSAGVSYFLSRRWHAHISKFAHSDRPDVLNAAFKQWCSLHRGKPACAYSSETAEAAVREKQRAMLIGR